MDDLHLDLENPRIGEVKDEDEAIALLLSSEKLLPLAEDIVDNGLNPLDNIAVRERDKRFIVVEGNRRVCAMKLLNNPSLATKETKKQLEKLAAKRSRDLSQVEVVVLTNDKEVRLWLERTHLGEQEGKGRRKWTADQKARFNKKPNHAMTLDRKSVV